MKFRSSFLSIALFAGCIVFSFRLQADPVHPVHHGPAAAIRGETVTYMADGLTCKGYVAYDENKKGKRPLVLVVHEWWGLNDYTRMRARKLAELGYIAMAVDMYGDGKVAADPKEAQELATPFYKYPKLAKSRLDAALAKMKEYSQADLADAAAIGYCYGGSLCSMLQSRAPT